jgi:hypothetical protein
MAMTPGVRFYHQAKTAMKKTTPASGPDAYLSALAGWRKAWVEGLHSAAAPKTIACRSDSGAGGGGSTPRRSGC